MSHLARSFVSNLFRLGFSRKLNPIIPVSFRVIERQNAAHRVSARYFDVTLINRLTDVADYPECVPHTTWRLLWQVQRLEFLIQEK